jgi:tagatose-1,6-bisphosphate aldolase
LRASNIIQNAIREARQKLSDAKQKNERASAALIEALSAAKAMIDTANQSMHDTDTTALLTKLLTEEEVQKVRQNGADYAKRLLADFDAARDEMNARFIKAIAADENAD